MAWGFFCCLQWFLYSEWKVFNVFCYGIPDVEKLIFTLGGDITFPLHITNSVNISKLITLTNIIIAVLLPKKYSKILLQRQERCLFHISFQCFTPY